MSVQDTKEKVFLQTIEMLKKDISSSQHEKVKEQLTDVLRMMFYEDREPIKKKFSKHWSDLMTWLLTEKPLSPDVLIRYLKVIQNLVRKNYQRYSVNIDYYFNPDVFVKSFKTKGLLESREKKIFLKQLLKDLSLTQEQVLMGKKTPTKVLEVSQERVLLKNMKDQLSSLRDAMIEEREMKIQEELDKTLDLLFMFQSDKLFPEAKKLWYDTLVWLLTAPNHSKNMKLKVLKMIQNKVRKLHKTSKKSYVEKVFPPEDFVYSMKSGALSKRKNTFLSQVLDHLRSNYKKDLTVVQVLTPNKAQVVVSTKPVKPRTPQAQVVVSIPKQRTPQAQVIQAIPQPPKSRMSLLSDIKKGNIALKSTKPASPTQVVSQAQVVVSTPKQRTPQAQVIQAIPQPPKSRMSLLSDIKKGNVALKSTKPVPPTQVVSQAQVVVSTPKQRTPQAQVIQAIPQPPKSRMSLLSDIKKGNVALKSTKPVPQKGKLSVLSAIRTGGVKLKPATQRKIKQAQSPKQNQNDLFAAVRKGLAAKKGLSNVEQQDNQQDDDDEWL